MLRQITRCHTPAVSTTIVVATDGSDLAIDAARQGLARLGPVDTILVVCAVEALDPSLAYDGSGHAGPSMTEDELERLQVQAGVEGRAALDRTVVALDLDPVRGQIETRVVEGYAGPALCQVAEEVSAEALVVGTRGRGGLKRAVLGSVSDHIVRNARCPVVVVNPSASSV